MPFSAPHFAGLVPGEVLTDSSGDKWTVIATVEHLDAILLINQTDGDVDGDTSPEFFKEGYTRDLIAASINQATTQAAGFFGHAIPPSLPSPAQGQQGPPPFFYYHGSGQPTVQAIIKLDDDPKPAKTRRQVSHNGKDWVDYRHLLDADDFELYAHRREV